MNEKLSCDIIRDLLPSYVDGLTSSATDQAVEEHLAACPACAAALRSMKEPEPARPEPLPEVDYLKKVRQRSYRNALIYGLGIVLLVAIVSFVRFFLVGQETGPERLAYKVSVTDNTIVLSGQLLDSGTGFRRADFQEQDGVVTITVFTAPRSPFSKNDIIASYTTSNNIREVRLGELVLWQDGVTISRAAAQVYAARNPYVGDMPANGRVAAALGVQDQLGYYQSELHTAAEPYGWDILLEQPIAAGQEQAARDIMAADSYVLLAAIGNLSFVTWEYATEAGESSYTVTAEDATAFAGQDIKSCCHSPAELQGLMQRLNIKWSGVQEAIQDQGTFYISIANYCDMDIYGLVMDYYLDGQPIGRAGTSHADYSPLTRGEGYEFDFSSEILPPDTTGVSLSGFSFDLWALDQDGNETLIRQNVPVAAKYAWTFFFTLNGDEETGFSLLEG